MSQPAPLTTTERSKRYWDRRIRPWEASVYERSTTGLSLLERAATLFRGPVRARMDETVRVITPWVSGKTIVDIGCGSGVLAERLLNAGAKKVIGLDIAPAGIAAANARLRVSGFDPSRHEFIEQNLATHPETPAADLATGLGFLDYLTPPEIVELFRHLRSPLFFFSFPEGQWSVRTVLHEGYLRLAGCPVFHKYSRPSFDQFLAEAGRLEHRQYYQRDQFRFIHNIAGLTRP